MCKLYIEITDILETDCKPTGISNTTESTAGCFSKTAACVSNKIKNSPRFQHFRRRPALRNFSRQKKTRILSDFGPFLPDFRPAIFRYFCR